MQNKENGNKRPCYFCFRDEKNQDIIQLDPISSKVKKYKTNKKDVEITYSLQKEVIEMSKKVIALANKGINIPFYNTLEMKSKF